MVVTAVTYVRGQHVGLEWVGVQVADVQASPGNSTWAVLLSPSLE